MKNKTLDVSTTSLTELRLAIDILQKRLRAYAFDDEREEIEEVINKRIDYLTKLL